ncbi:MAG: peptidylprolyl isomerase [Myxococcales bacterium]|nr:peptidylprolyl isomerase [Myxococcales bacterium]
MSPKPRACALCATLSALAAAVCLSAACAPTSRAGVRQEVIPTPSVLRLGGEQGPERVAVRAIYVLFQGAEGAPPSIERSKGEAQKRARAVADSAQGERESFVELEMKYSDRPPLKDGGGPGVLLERGSGLLPPEAEAAAFCLKVGEVSGALETVSGFVIVKRTAEPEAATQEVRIGARHILVAYAGSERASPEVTRTREQARTLAIDIVKRARAGEDWDALWKEHSDEPGGRPGGDLGLFGHGVMVPSFEQAAFALEVDQVSDVIETPFGFHVIQRTK